MGCRSLDMLGAISYLGAAPSKTDVQKFQGGIMGLPADKQEPEFRALAKAVNGQTNAFGEYGPATKAAAAKFNKLYGDPNDGENITAQTLGTLANFGAAVAKKSADIAELARLEAQAKEQAEKAKVAAPAQVAAVKQEAAATVKAAEAKAETPEQKQEVAAAEAALEKAATPDETQAAIVRLQKTIEEMKAARGGETKNWLLRETVIPKVPNYGVVGGVVALLGGAWYLLRHRVFASMGG